MEVHQRNAEPWKVTLIDTGDETMTGGRIKRISNYVKDEEYFCMTYGDGVGDINITDATGKNPHYYSHNRRASDFGFTPKFTSIEGVMLELKKLFLPIK